MRCLTCDKMYHLDILLMFCLYLRPSEALRIRMKDVVSPVRGKGSSYRWWSFVLHPLESGVPSKTLEFDETLVLDLPYHKNLGAAVKRFCTSNGRLPEDSVFQHTLGELNLFLASASKTLNLESLGAIHAYRFRHGGASHDYHNKLRDLQGIQQRGRWKSQASVRRYQKGARLAQLFGSLCKSAQNAAIKATKGLARALADLR